MSHAHDSTVPHHHVTSGAVLIATFIALVALTVLTSVLAQVDMGRADIFVTLGIAVVKSAMVALIFMHLLHDKLFNGVILLSAIVFMALFLGIVLMDSGQYEAQIRDYVEDQQALLPPA
ncbi:hypothetical protein Pla175_50570 [Pirellulimonas nuda]|uniref:Uncharacterized protein n=1 Tax=Pirellulimonas nuda TaxID=2528009 RepID=A0A518DJH1_9BACT|nr:cytochrome C oxidase subunit IV family protein [Pirellulimonas nuda]QDU91627.1 hypothetical protein Pla175_50570 [Pirellulimonas nuda]